MPGSGGVVDCSLCGVSLEFAILDCIASGVVQSVFFITGRLQFTENLDKDPSIRPYSIQD